MERRNMMERSGRRRVIAAALGMLLVTACADRQVEHMESSERVTTAIVVNPQVLQLKAPMPPVVKNVPPTPAMEKAIRPSNRNQRFVKKYIGLAREVRNRYAVPIDLTLAQASHESGYGSSGLTQKCHAFFGIKAHSSGFAAWNGPVFGTPTREVLSKEQLAGRRTEKVTLRTDGKYDAIVIDGFRCYKTDRESFLDYGNYLQNRGRGAEGEYYADAQDETTALGYLKEILDDDDGPDGGQKSYATDPAYLRIVTGRIAEMHSARQALGLN